MVVAVAMLIAADSVGGGGGDNFTARDVWRFVAILTAGYIISCGLAKAGSYEVEWERPEVADSAGLAERLSAAAAALKGEDTHAGDGGSHEPVGPGAPPRR